MVWHLGSESLLQVQVCRMDRPVSQHPTCCLVQVPGLLYPCLIVRLEHSTALWVPACKGGR